MQPFFWLKVQNFVPRLAIWQCVFAITSVKFPKLAAKKPEPKIRGLQHPASLKPQNWPKIGL